MKITYKVIFVAFFTALFFTYPNTINAQKRRKAVKKHIKRKHKIKKAKLISRNRYKNLPRRGKVVRRLGTGAVNINFKGAKFYVYNGVWYKQPVSNINRFIVVKAPIGGRVHTRVPWLTRPKIIIGKRVYYYYYGTYYEEKEGSEEMVVVNAPIGAKIDALPEGYDTIEVNGLTYYRLDDVYYQFVINEDNDTYFIVTKKPLL